MSSSIRVAVAIVCALLGWPSALRAQPQTFASGDVFLSTTGGLVYGYRFDPASQGWVVVSVLITESPEFPATGSAFDRDGNVYVATFTSGQVSGKVVRFARDWDPTTGSSPIETFGFAPKSVVLDAQGNLFVGHARRNAPVLQCAAATGPIERGDIITKIDSSGACVGAYQVDVEGLAQAGDAGESREGADWVDLAADQRTIFYTSQGRRILRFDTQANTQLPDFAILPDEDPRCDPTVPPPPGLRCGQAFALRLLPDGGLLVADNINIKRLDASGQLVGSPYDRPGHDNWFSLNLDPDGVSFWSGDADTGQVHRFDLATGAVLASIDTGLVQGLLLGVSVFEEPIQARNPLGSVSGIVYADANRNRLRDEGEPGLEGVSVTLTGGPGGTTLTTPDGSYTFQSLPAGEYAVAVPPQAVGRDLFSTVPAAISLGPAQNVSDVNFGYVHAAISGVVYADLDADGLRDPGEPGIPNISIALGGGAATTALTDAAGGYSFGSLLAGQYTSTAPPTAAGKGLSTAGVLTVALAAGQVRTDADFGYRPGAIEGFAFLDSDGDGLRDPGEPGVEGVIITGPAGASTTSGPDGFYTFAQLDAGEYAPAAQPAAGGNTLATPSPLSVALPAGQTITDVNFGYVTPRPALTLVKTANPTEFSHAGQEIVYKYVLANAGSAVLNGPFTVTDDKLGSFPCGDQATLNPGASISCTRTYVVRSGDLGNVPALPSGVPAIVDTGAWLQGRMSTQDTGIDGAAPFVPAGVYPGWCIQDHVPRDLHGEGATLYSTLGSLPADVAKLPWGWINHVLNHKLRGPGKTDLDFFKDVQTAIWLLVGERQPSFGISPEARQMVVAALAAPAFVPGPGDVVAVVIYSDGMGTAPGTVQESIIEVRPMQTITNVATATAQFQGTRVTSNEVEATVSQVLLPKPATVHHPGDRYCWIKSHRHPLGDDCRRPLRQRRDAREPAHDYPAAPPRPSRVRLPGFSSRRRSTSGRPPGAGRA
jgi:hypothetical protein